jgi:hypothetical protein
VGRRSILLPDVRPSSSHPIHPRLDHIGKNIKINLGVDPEAGLKDVGGMTSSLLLTTPRTITVAGNLVFMTIGTSLGSSHSHLWFRVHFLILGEVLFIRKEDQNVWHWRMLQSIKQVSRFFISGFLVHVDKNWPLRRL